MNITRHTAIQYSIVFTKGGRALAGVDMPNLRIPNVGELVYIKEKCYRVDQIATSLNEKTIEGELGGTYTVEVRLD